MTADTYGDVQDKTKDLDCKLFVLDSNNQDLAKQELVLQLGSEFTVGIGNGRNDCLMIKAAALGIVVVQEEGSFAETLISADVACTHIRSALALLIHPLRLVATLRS